MLHQLIGLFPVESTQIILYPQVGELGGIYERR